MKKQARLPTKTNANRSEPGASRDKNGVENQNLDNSDANNDFQNIGAEWSIGPEDSGNTDGSEDESERFLGWEHHHIKDLTKGALRFVSMWRWLSDNEYCCILLNFRDFDMIEPSVKGQQIPMGVLTMDIGGLDCVLHGCVSWGASEESLQVGPIKIKHMKYHVYDGSERRIYIYGDRVLIHTRMFIAFDVKYSLFEDLVEDLTAIKDKVHSVFGQ